MLLPARMESFVPVPVTTIFPSGWRAISYTTLFDSSGLNVGSAVTSPSRRTKAGQRRLSYVVKEPAASTVPSASTAIALTESGSPAKSGTKLASREPLVSNCARLDQYIWVALLVQ